MGQCVLWAGKYGNIFRFFHYYLCITKYNCMISVHGWFEWIQLEGHKITPFSHHIIEDNRKSLLSSSKKAKLTKKYGNKSTV